MSSVAIKKHKYWQEIAFRPVSNRHLVSASLSPNWRFDRVVPKLIVDTGVSFLRFESLLQDIHWKVTTNVFSRSYLYSKVYCKSLFSLLNLVNLRTVMSNFEWKWVRFCLRPFLCTAWLWFWAVNFGSCYCQHSTFIAHSKSSTACFIWKCEKSERIKI